MKKLLAIIILGFLFSINAYGAGCIEGNCNNGYGVGIYTNGNKYSGNFKNKKRHGKGVMIYKKSGNIYEGTWIDNKKNGSFIVTDKNGNKFIGLYKDGKKNGSGAFFQNINGKLKLLHVFEYKSSVKEGDGVLVHRERKEIKYLTMKNDKVFREKRSTKYNKKNYNNVLINYNLQNFDEQPVNASLQFDSLNTPLDTSGTQSTSSNNKNNISFTIKDKREQCEAIGFKPQTEKFADCVLRLVELDVKKQQSNEVASNNNASNKMISKQLEIQNKELERQRRARNSQYLMDLGQKLLQPQSSGYSTCSYIDLGGGMSKVKCN